jgi:hypothetical protein
MTTPDTIPKPATDDQADFQKRLAALAERGQAKLREFEQTGHLSETHKNLADRFKTRHEAVGRKLNTLPRSGEGWDSVKEELERDYKALSDDVHSFTESMDADAMKNKNR